MVNYCYYSNAPKTFVGLLVVPSSVSFFTAVRMISDNDSSGNDLDTMFVNNRRLKSVCSSEIVSATLIQSNVTSDRSRTMSEIKYQDLRLERKIIKSENTTRKEKKSKECLEKRSRK